jgi:hypothetical protein
VTFLIQLTCCEVLLLLTGFFALVVLQLLTGEISTKGLLYGTKGDGSQYLSPERVQLLLFTLALAFQYLAQVLSHPESFPVLPESWIVVMGGSHLVYLGGKLGALLIGRK